MICYHTPGRKHLPFFKVFFYSDLNITRFLLGLAEMIWAISLFWPGDTFSRPTYDVMSSLASEHFWASTFLLTSLLQFFILFLKQTQTRFAIVFAAWNTLLWWYVCISMYLSVYPPPAAISGELTLAFAASLIFIRSGYIVIGGRRNDP